MAIKVKLSEEDKKRFSKLVNAIEDDEKESKQITKTQTKSSQSISLPTANKTKDNSLPTYNYRQNISTKMDRLPTARLAKEDEAKTAKRIDYYNSVRPTEEMNSNDLSVSIPANIRYTLERGKQGIKNYGTSILQNLETSIADDNQKALDNKLFSNLYTEEGKKKLEDTNTKLVNKVLEQNAVRNATELNSMQVSPTMQEVGAVSENIGNMIPSMTLNYLLPGLGTAGMFMSSSGSASAEALENDRSIREAKLSGDMKGAIEVGMEKITGGIKFLPKGTLDNTATHFISNNIKSKVGQFLLSKGYEIGGEVLEEVLTDIGNNIVDKFMYQDDRRIVDFEQLGETAKLTVLSTLALNALGLGGGTYKDVQQQNKVNEANKWINEAQEIVNQENAKDSIAQIQENPQEQQAVSQNNMSIQNQSIKQNNIELQVANENNRYTKSQLDEILNNKELPMQYYQYEKSNNAKVNKLRQDASKYFNNTEQSRNYINMLEKIVSDKDVEIRFDGNLKTPDGRIANGSYSDGVITINPNSSKAGEFIAIHELTHAIGTKDMIDMIENYRKSNVEFDEQVKSLLQNYKTTEINEEALSDVSAELFGNKKFINEIAQNKPSFFKKIYSEIKYLWHQFRGYKNQNEFISDLYYKWTDAYNSNKELNRSEKYSAVYNEDGTFNRVKINDNIFENRKGKTIEATIKEYLTNHIGEYADIIESGQRVYLGKDLPGEYVYSKSANSLSTSSKFAKGRAVTGLKEIIENATNRTYEANNKTKHNIDAKYGFYRYDTTFSFDYNGSEQVYQGKILIRNDADGKKYLYDILGIKKIGSNSLSQASNSQKSSAIIDSPSSLPTNSIAPAKTDVNTTNKYSMQNSENNTWQQYLEKNFKTEGERTNLQDILVKKADNKGSFSKKQKNNTLEKTNTQTTVPELIETQQFIMDKRSQNRANLKEIKDALAQKIVNKGHYIDKLAKQTNNPQLTYKYDRTMNAFNEAQVCIGDKQVDMNGKVVGDSLIDVFSGVEKAKLSKEFDDYLLNKHNIARNPIGKGIFGDTVTAPMSSKKVDYYEAKYPQFKEWSKKVNKYNDNNLKDLVNAKMITEDTYKNLRELYGDYVPTFRDIVETKQEFDERIGNNPLKRASKSDKMILSPKEAMAEQTVSIKKAIRINEVGKELYKILGKDSTFIDGINFDTMSIESLNSSDIITKSTDGNNIFTIFDGEKMIQFKISDELYSAFSKDTLQNKINNSKVAKTLLTPVEKLSKAQRDILTTYSIGFALNNPIKDLQDAVFNTKYGVGSFAKNYTKALYNIATEGDWYQSYKNNGGGANTYFDYNRGILNTKKNLLKKFGDNIKAINEIFEQTPRLAEYISTIEHGGSVNEALYNSAEITTNFKRGGDWTKVANKYGANFLNASVQGLDKVYRNVTGQNGFKGYANLAVKATLYQIAPAILNHLLLKDDDEYERLPEYAKDNYYLFKLNDNGDFLRIPKGRVSSVVGAIARRVTQTVQEDEEVDWKSIVDTAINQLAPNNPFSDNIFAPIKQVSENKTWYGGDIVSSRLQKHPDAEQFDETTDKFSVWLGSKLNISPKKINYLLDQYSGGVGDIVLPILTPQAENNIITDKFTINSTIKNKNVSKYYSLLEEAEEQKNSSNATEEDKLKYKYLFSASEDLNDLYIQKREIQMSETLTDKEKKEKVQEIQKKINNIAEGKINGISGVKAEGNTATADGEEYYKKDGKWTTLDEEEKAKNKNISLATYSDYKNKVYNMTQNKKANGEISEDGQLKDKDKISIIRNGSYSNKEKTELYENYVLKDSSKDKFEIIKKTFNLKSDGLNINSYLDYKQQEFTPTKKDDGTVKGKSIYGSKENKVIDYINSIKGASYTQKMVLYALEYKPDKSDRDLVVNFVQSNWKGKEQEKMLSRFEWITIYKDGRIGY